MKSFYILTLCFFAILNLSSCNIKKEEILVEFDNSYPLALAPDVSWAVIKDPFVAYQKEADWNSEVLGHCRQGEILQVIGKSYDVNSKLWFLFDQGYVAESSLVVFPNRYKAQSYSNNITTN